MFLKKTGRIQFFIIIRIELKNKNKKTYFFSFEWKNWGGGGEDYLEWWRFGYTGGSSEIFSVIALEGTTKTHRWVKDELTSTSHSKDKD